VGQCTYAAPGLLVSSVYPDWDEQVKPSVDSTLTSPSGSVVIVKSMTKPRLRANREPTIALLLERCCFPRQQETGAMHLEAEWHA
jgi:hypothetical protein